MKIDFDASYKELARLVSVSARGDAIHEKGDSPFGKLLSSISPNAPKTVEKTTVSTDLPVDLQEDILNTLLMEEDTSEPLASLKLPTPEQLFSTPEPVSVPFDPAEENAKKLSVVEVRRIRSNEQLARMRTQDRMTALQPMIENAGTSQGVDPALGMSIASIESAFNPLAVSRDGHNSKGVFQLLDETGLDMKKRLAVKEAYDPFNAEQNVKFGIAYLRYLHDIFSTSTPLSNNLVTVPAANSASLEKLAVAAFNAGEGRVAAAQKRATRAGYDPAEYLQVEGYLPESTQEYVRRVMASKFNFGSIFEG